MGRLLYSINVTLDGCVDHRSGVADEALHQHAMAGLERADALLFGRVTYQMMEDAWRPPASDAVAVVAVGETAGTTARPEGLRPTCPYGLYPHGNDACFREPGLAPPGCAA